MLLLGLSFVLILLVLPSIVSDSSVSTIHRQQLLYKELSDINSRSIGTTLLCFGLPVCELRDNNKPFGNSSGTCNSSSAKLQFLTLSFCFWVFLIRPFLCCSIWEFCCCDQANLSLFAYLVGVKSIGSEGLRLSLSLYLSLTDFSPLSLIFGGVVPRKFWQLRRTFRNPFLIAAPVSCRGWSWGDSVRAMD